MRSTGTGVGRLSRDLDPPSGPTLPSVPATTAAPSPSAPIGGVTQPRLLTLADLAATGFCAVVGAHAGVAAGLDLFGLMVVAFASALGGGMIRDLLIGDTPPAALRSIAYPLVAFGGGGAVYLFDRVVNEFPIAASHTLDAAGLGLFCVIGAAKALDHGLRPLAAVLLGTITGVGGGIIGDVLVNDLPSVLVADEYATAAVVGSALMVTLSVLGVRRPRAMLAGGLTCFVVWIVNFGLGWQLPRAIGG